MVTEVIRVHQPDRLLELIGIIFAVFGFGMIGFLSYVGANPRQALGPPFLKVSAGCVLIIGILAIYGATLNPVVAVELQEDRVTLQYTRGADTILVKGDVQSVRLIHPLPHKGGPSTIRLDGKTGKRYYIRVGRRESRDLAERIALCLGLIGTDNQTNNWVQ